MGCRGAWQGWGWGWGAYMGGVCPFSDALGLYRALRTPGWSWGRSGVGGWVLFVWLRTLRFCPAPRLFIWTRPPGPLCWGRLALFYSSVWHGLIILRFGNAPPSPSPGPIIHRFGPMLPIEKTLASLPRKLIHSILAEPEPPRSPRTVPRSSQRYPEVTNLVHPLKHAFKF